MPSTEDLQDLTHDALDAIAEAEDLDEYPAYENKDDKVEFLTNNLPEDYTLGPEQNDEPTSPEELETEDNDEEEPEEEDEVEQPDNDTSNEDASNTDQEVETIDSVDEVDWDSLPDDDEIVVKFERDRSVVKKYILTTGLLDEDAYRDYKRYQFMLPRSHLVKLQQIDQTVIRNTKEP